MFCEQLGDALEEAYRLIAKVESAMVTNVRGLKLSINELHLLEAVRKGGERGSTISDIAARLSITLSSVTVGVNKLERKGLVVKCRDKSDGRVVLVRLTETGRKAERVHHRFYRSLACSLSQNVTLQEQRLLLNSLKDINQFLRIKARKMEAKK